MIYHILHLILLFIHRQKNAMTTLLYLLRVKKIFGEITNYHIGGDAADLGSELLKEVVIYYYFFLAEEVIDFNMKRIAENKNAMNLFGYRIGLH